MNDLILIGLALAAGVGICVGAAYLMSRRKKATGSEKAQLRIKRQENVSADYQKMLREIRSWGLWLLGFGVLHLLASGLSSPWGVLLLIVGLASFCFRDASMFVVYGVTLAWAAVSNLISGEMAWMLFAAVQFGLAVHVFRQFFRFRQAQLDHTAHLAQSARGGPSSRFRVNRIFPWVGCFLGAAAVSGVIAVFGGMMVYFSVTEDAKAPAIFDFLLGLTLNLAILGLAVNLASLLSKYEHKVVTVLGLIASVVMILFWIVMVLA